MSSRNSTQLTAQPVDGRELWWQCEKRESEIVHITQPIPSMGLLLIPRISHNSASGIFP